MAAVENAVFAGQVTPRRRWLIAASVSTALCVCWFLYVNADGCWLFWRGCRAIAILSFPWVFVTLAVGLRNTGRVLLVALTLIFAFFSATSESNYVAATESRAVGRLRSFQSALHSGKHQHGGYPDGIPTVSMPYPVERYYRFQYTPVADTSGTVTDYLVQATPMHPARLCGCVRSFAADSKGQIHYTIENRPATIGDQVLK
jgi:hypothetical protein